MSRTIGAVRNHAPYLYLTKETDTSTKKFVLFILVSAEAGKKVVYNDNISYDGGVTTINVSVQDDTNGVAGRYPYKLLLDYTADSRFDAASYCVRVITSYTSNNTTQKLISKYIFQDVSDVDPTEGSSIVNVAYECPYMYLTNPNTESGDPGNEYFPYCIILLNTLDFSDASCVPDSGVNDAGCHQTVNLKSGPPPTGESEVDVNEIQANKRAYTDPNGVDQRFEVVVNYHNGKKKKGLIPDVSSDTNPSSFIDNNPFF